MNIMYDIEYLKFSYNEQFTLEISDFNITKGKSVGLIGPNGSGKTTLLKLLAFLEYPTDGYIVYNDRIMPDNITTISKNVTMLFQNPYLLKKNVFDNVAYGLKLRKNTKNIKSSVFEALEWVGLAPEKFSKKKWFELSGGEGQRVALASRLVLKPDVLILDEPTGSVDKSSASLIKKAVEFIRSEYNTTLIISSHDTFYLNSVTDNIYRIYDGRITGFGHENLVEGSWYYEVDDLWIKDMGDGQKIRAVKPPEKNSAALLYPTDIIISLEHPGVLSAQNILKGRIANMSATRDMKVNLEIDVSGQAFTCYVTQHAAKELELLPGKDIWMIFKATSLRWQ